MVAKTLFQIEIPRRNTQCFHAKETFTASMAFFSLLIEDPEQGTIRRDYCQNCWNLSEHNALRTGDHTFWKGKVPQKVDAARLPTDQNERVFYLLREALLSDDLIKHEEAFVLALFLARRRLIALRQERKQEGETFLIYEVLDTEEMLAVKKIELHQLQVEAIQKTLAEKMKM